jgi:transposase
VDPFHVIEWAMDALDTVRVDAWREAKAKTLEQPKAKQDVLRKKHLRRIQLQQSLRIQKWH